MASRMRLFWKVTARIASIGMKQHTQRIIGYDFARALAILGMVLVNFVMVMGAESNGPLWLQHLIGHPVVVIPVGFTQDGLPLGCSL